MARPTKLDWLQPAILTGSLVPFAWLLYRAVRGMLGANPIATALNQLGLLALLFLLASLACTPLKILFDLKWPLRLRKTLGLFAFWSALLHFLIYALFDQVMQLGAIVEDVLKRPFILVGFLGLVTLTPLALTSTKNALRRIGPRRWQRLHRLAYLAGILGAVHFLLRVKADLLEPAIYLGVLAFLLAVRLWDRLRKQRLAAQRP
ncbi:MAG: protein-methionine-sulfoxide reductase heme-binding subunit MsrQ [Polyangiaceae bacterium]